MGVDTSKLKNQLAQRASNPAQAATPEQRVYQFLEQMKPQIQRALPRHMDADRLARVALTTIRTTPKLLECNTASLMAAVMQAAQLGLEPGLVGHCYIVPYGREATFIIGYKGMLDLARRSGQIESIAAYVVYDKDEFEVEFGLNEKLRHVPKFEGERGQPRLVYAYAKLVGGGHQVIVMTRDEIEAVRKRSKAATNGPWVTDWEEMAKKTAIRRLFKYLPISIEIARAIEGADETIKHEIAEDMTEVPAIDVEVVKSEDAPDDTPPAQEAEEPKPESAPKNGKLL